MNLADIGQLVTPDGAYQSRRILWDEEIYQLELQQIFARCWLFLTHENQIPNPGDFITTTMGEDEVIVARHKDGSVKAFINSCTHRGNKICYAESGNSHSFTCNYHGWVFGTDGALVGVPLESDGYKNHIDKAKHAAKSVAQISSFHGFVFATFDPEAPPLEEYLGEMAWYLETFMVGSGGAELMGPPMKSILRCNWKVPVENFEGDAYHVGWTHASALKAIGQTLEKGGIAGNPLELLIGNRGVPEALGLQIKTARGHGFDLGYGLGSAFHLGDAPEYMQWVEEQRPKVIERLGKIRGELFYGSHYNCSIFPNLSFLYGINTFKVWQPRGPREIEVYTWTLVEKGMPYELKKRVRHGAIKTFGTAGTLESDDGENMEQCTRSNRGYITRQEWINTAMGLGTEKPRADLPGEIADGFVGESSHRGLYRFWREIMMAKDWKELSEKIKKREAA